MNNEALNEAQGPNRDAPMPTENPLDIQDVWFRKHDFVLPDAWLLVADLQGKLWRSLRGKQPVIDIILAEKIRQLSAGENKMASTVDVIPGKALEVNQVIYDMVYRPLDLYARLRAYFMTMAYVSIHNPAFFDLQTALYVSEKILGLVTSVHKKQMAPISFYVEAWAATIHHFAEQVRVAKVTLKTAVLNTGSWEHKWTGYTPPLGNGGAPGGGHGQVELPQNISNEVEDLRKSVRKWQAENDRKDAEIRRLQNSGGSQFYSGHGGGSHAERPRSRSRQNNGGGKGRGNGGGGKSKKGRGNGGGGFGNNGGNGQRRNSPRSRR
jgi:hypothetical protein